MQGTLVLIMSLRWKILEVHPNLQDTKSLLRLPMDRILDFLKLKIMAREKGAIMTIICGLVPREIVVSTCSESILYLISVQIVPGNVKRM